jgi:dihydrodipicolinate reductase
MAETKKLKIGITGSNGRIGTVLRTAFSKVPEYHVRYFTYDPPEGSVFQTVPIPDEFEKRTVDFSKRDQVCLIIF